MNTERFVIINRKAGHFSAPAVSRRVRGAFEAALETPRTDRNRAREPRTRIERKTVRGRTRIRTGKSGGRRHVAVEIININAAFRGCVSADSASFALPSTLAAPSPRAPKESMLVKHARKLGLRCLFRRGALTRLLSVFRGKYRYKFDSFRFLPCKI